MNEQLAAERRQLVEKLKKQNPFLPLYEVIHAVLREEVITCTLVPGAVLREVDLAESFGISRTTVRNALDALRADGFAEHAGRSMRVTLLTRLMHDQLHDFRKRLDTIAAEFAAQRRGKADIDTLQQLLDACANEQDPFRFLAADSRFHRGIYEAAHNSFLLQSYAQIEPTRNRINYFAIYTLEQDGMWEMSQSKIDRMNREHASILTAIISGDDEEAARLADKHVASQLISFDTYEKLFLEQ